MAPEIEVRCARRRGVEAILSAKARIDFGIVEDRPGHDHLLVVGAGPFDIGDGDPAEHAATDRVVDERRLERLRKSLALQGLLLRIHRIGDVDRDHEREIDLRIGAGREDGERQKEREPEDEAVETTHNHRGLLNRCRSVAEECDSFYERAQPSRANVMGRRPPSASPRRCRGPRGRRRPASRPVVSRIAASSAALRGAAARLRSRSSRRRMSARMTANSAVSPRARSSRWRRRARSSGVGGDEELHVGRGADDGADVAPVEDGARPAGSRRCAAQRAAPRARPERPRRPRRPRPSRRRAGADRRGGAGRGRWPRPSPPARRRGPRRGR